MGTVVIGDLHYGAKLSQERFIAYQIDEWIKFIDYCKANNIDQIVILGDFFDDRNNISVKMLDIILNQVLPDMKIFLLIGNHDTLYKNTSKVNAPRLLFHKYKNVEVIDTAMELFIEGTKVLFVPWINKENWQHTKDIIERTDAEYCFGHLELNGFEMTSGIKCVNGLKPSIFKKFKRVYTGHWHLVQLIKNIQYVGSFYQITWSDCGDQKFIYMVGPTFKLEKVPLVRSIFKKIYLTEKEPISQEHIDASADCYVKVYLNYKMDAKDEKLLSKMFDHAIKVTVIDLRLLLEEPDDRDVEDEDFLEIFNGFMEIQEDLDDDVKAGVIALMKKTYSEALENA